MSSPLTQLNEEEQAFRDMVADFAQNEIDRLRRHVRGRAHNVLRRRHGASKRSAARPEVRQLQCAVAVDKHVGWFDVAVQDALAVQVRQPLQRLLGVAPHNIFVQPAPNLVEDA